MGLILIPTAISQSFASQMEVFLIPESDQADPIFTSIRFINLKYEPGSELSKIFNEDGIKWKTKMRKKHL